MPHAVRPIPVQLRPAAGPSLHRAVYRCRHGIQPSPGATTTVSLLSSLPALGPSSCLGSAAGLVCVLYPLSAERCCCSTDLSGRVRPRRPAAGGGSARSILPRICPHPDPTGIPRAGLCALFRTSVRARACTLSLPLFTVPSIGCLLCPGLGRQKRVDSQHGRLSGHALLPTGRRQPRQPGHLWLPLHAGALPRAIRPRPVLDETLVSLCIVYTMYV